MLHNVSDDKHTAKRQTYADGVAAKKMADTGVKKLFIIGHGARHTRKLRKCYFCLVKDFDRRYPPEIYSGHRPQAGQHYDWFDVAHLITPMYMV